jgi:hypothetical protein
VNVSRHDRDFKMLPPRRHPDTSVEYDGNNPLRLAEEIDAALDKYGLSTIAACSRASNSLRASCA